MILTLKENMMEKLEADRKMKVHNSYKSELDLVIEPEGMVLPMSPGAVYDVVFFYEINNDVELVVGEYEDGTTYLKLYISLEYEVYHNGILIHRY